MATYCNGEQKIDNLKAAVTQADWYDPELNPKLVAFCRHYGTMLPPPKPYMPRHKGKIESGIKYVRRNALKGRCFEALSAQNTHLAHRESHVADLRIHGTTKRQVPGGFCDRAKCDTAATAGAVPVLLRVSARRSP